ncbi:unnamed protein product [Leptosia nina]|uniref:Lipocalin/cytosolic fatty-acid binding domain-containing protein n=1 Tax=Leptosia nina TaxID=320188 RepID=A0AAV1JLQ0_9NEOP
MLLLMLSVCLGLTSAVLQDGQCENGWSLQTDFDIEKFTGKWYSIRSNTPWLKGDCSYIDIEQADNQYKLQLSYVKANAVVEKSGAAVSSESARFNLIIDGGSIDFNVLTTDYNNYALVYSCENVGTSQRNVYVWQLARDVSNSDGETRQRMDEVISNFGLSANVLTETSHSDAACYVEPFTGQPIVLPGQCDSNIAVVANFNFTRFEGEWRLIETYYNRRQTGACNRVTYTDRGSTLGVVHTHILNKEKDFTTATATFSSNNTDGKLTVTGVNAAAPFWILDTDYISYALAYSCENQANNQKRISSWKLSRTNILPAQAVQNINRIVNTVSDLDNNNFIAVDQSDEACFYYPFLLENDPVILPGQCDTNVSVVADFNLNRFSGEWRLISSYFNERQSGTCNRAHYTVQGTSLGIENRHVINERLYRVPGTATFATAVQDGRLRVTMGTNSVDYWILDTDYDSYALAYSCRNLENNQRRIFSWKLSRTNTLPNQANTNINAIINRVDALNENYYQNADQSDSACFYLPEFQPNQPVIFPGQCSQNIFAVANFDLHRFSGEWRLISSYHNERQVGTCNRAEYTIDGDSYIIKNSHVLTGGLDSVRGTARFASDNIRDGKFLVTVGQNTRDYWILNTDYDSYALAYSCENLANNQKRIFSWKLSRTNTLSQQAVEAINRVFLRVPELDDKYFVNADQSEAACFYLPAVDATKPVVFRGQCNENIAVVRNFEATRYMGQWYDIESYPSNFQGGTCNSAFYSRRDNFLDVTNTQVVNQRISVRQGVGRFAESEQIAKLSLNFASSSSRDYWVLATDYTSYSLVYSCVNIDSQHKQVGAWKLSRTKQLTATAVTAINSAMANINVLEARYFVQRDHSTTGCSYNTNIQAGDQVVLPGTCPTNITPMAGFDFGGFIGTWFEVQTYPIDFWSGQCSQQQFFTAAADRLTFVSRSVKNQEFIEIRGTASRVTADGSGRLTITLENAGGTFAVPFTVLRTDYREYALAYGCVTLNSNLKRIYSWKLGRNRSLSAEANAEINRIITATPDLEDRYYANVDHSSSGCFYLPDIPLGQAVILPGQCNQNVPVVTDFNIDNFLGTWRLISSYYTHRQSGECNQAEYFRDGTTIRVRNSHVLNGDRLTTSGTVSTIDRSGKLTVTISTRTVDYWILSTDYESYALAYSCSNLNENQRRVFSWKLSRSTTLTPNAQSAINNVINQVDALNDRYYQDADQSESACFYYPPVNANQPVVFQGQCDPNIPVQKNFLASQYLGTWYDIESYPSNFQYGTCNTARYSARGNDVLITNSQIVNASVSTREAVGIFSEGNTVGKLRVNFGTEDREYWVLSTDYRSYALVYSCKNIDANTKQVGTWKLSRTRTLEQSARNAIAVVMQNIRVLDERYFIARDHSDSGCFYHREQQDNSIIFSGQCDTSINAVPNFNMSRFVGIWNEIEIYPSEMSWGECLSQEYTPGSGSSLNMVQRNVRLETLFENRAVVSQMANDTSGKLSLRIQNAFDVTLPFWVLSTDYSTYAFAYGCINLSANERQVFSWKLSREQQLSTAASNAIKAVKRDIAVLDDRYYRTVDQSPEACFHLPDLGPEDSVILPGQCDVNIPAVRNFNAQQYSGTWYQIEKYHQRYEGGNCTGARYTFNRNSDTVTVLNWHVVNGVLDTITGNATVISSDGSGRLRVSLPIRPNNTEFRETSLYILDTDYTSYSLAYSCINVDSDRRAIGAWKLSRTRTMSAAGNTAIDAYMATRKELQSAYFTPVGQSDSCPEPNSASLIKNSIIMIAMLCASLLYL